MGPRLDLGGPGSQTIKRFSGSSGQFSGAQHGASAMGQQHAQVAIPLLRDSPQLAAVARGELLRCQPELAGKVPGILEVADTAAGGGNHRGGREQADAGNGQQFGTGRALPGQRSQFFLQLRNA